MTKRLGRRAILAGAGATLALGAAAAGIVYWKKRGPLPLEDAAPDRARRDFRVALPAAAPRMAIATGAGGAAGLAEKAVAALGTLGRFVQPGDVVAIKPNIGWARSPAQAANTNPELVAFLVTAALAAGAKRVVVTDGSCNDAERSFEASGIAARASDAGADVVLPRDELFAEHDIRGRLLVRWPVLETVFRADKVINVPVAKHHGLARFTGAMKNWFGVLGSERGRLHGNLDVAITDIASYVRPTLTVIDASTVMLRNGPKGGSLADLKQADTVIATLDEVAGDAYACGLVGLVPADVTYLALGAELGLGTSDWESLRPLRV